jgi:hypothetical protein
MDPKYHIHLVTNPASGYERTAKDAVLVEKAIMLYSKVETAIINVVENGDYKQYIDSIREYDKFIWEASHEGDKSNLFAYKKIKVSPSWTEQIWAPVFERIRLSLNEYWKTELVLIQNKQVVESINKHGPTAYKDVDGGIAVSINLNGKNYLMPVVVAEMKTGHFCKTACTGVDAIMRRVLTMNSNVLGFAITDNNISVSKDAEVENVFGSGATLIQQRGIGFNNLKNIYPELDYRQLELVEKICKNYFKTKQLTDFTNVKSKKALGMYLRETIDATGRYIPENLQVYVP